MITEDIDSELENILAEFYFYMDQEYDDPDYYADIIDKTKDKIRKLFQDD